MKKLGKKIMAFAMAAAVMMSSSTTALAADVAQGYATGSGGIIGTVDKNVFDVVLPTNTEGTFNFTLDPQKLLHAYEPTTYQDADTTLYFDTKTNKSDELEITNKSSMDVNVSIEAKMTNTAKLTMVQDPASFEGSKETSLYLGLILDGEAPVALEQEGTVEATTTLNKVPEDQWEMKGNPLSDEGATWELKDNATGFDVTKFQMTGACNSNADWTEISKAKKSFNPTFDVTWTIEAAEGDGDEEVAGDKAPSAPATATFIKGTALNIPVNLGSGDLAATAITQVAQNATTAAGPFTTNNNITFSGTTVTIAASMWGGASSGDKRYIQVTFDDAASTKVVIEITIQ